MKALFVISVSPENRILCQRPGCGKAVWKRIHVLETPEGELVLWGATCAGAVLGTGGKNTNYPHKTLTDEERDRLLSNTRSLVQALQDQILQQGQHLLSESFGDTSSKQTNSSYQQTPVDPPRLKSARKVQCYYCYGPPFETDLAACPAVGWKCPKCKENRVPMPIKDRNGKLIKYG